MSIKNGNAGKPKKNPINWSTWAKKHYAVSHNRSSRRGMSRILFLSAHTPSSVCALTQHTEAARLYVMHWSELCKVKTQIMVCSTGALARGKHAFMARSLHSSPSAASSTHDTLWIGCRRRAHTHTACVFPDIREHMTQSEMFVCVLAVYICVWVHAYGLPLISRIVGMRVWLLLFRLWMPIGRRCLRGGANWISQSALRLYKRESIVNQNWTK